jgi:hypothetical protein
MYRIHYDRNSTVTGSPVIVSRYTPAVLPAFEREMHKVSARNDHSLDYYSDYVGW